MAFSCDICKREFTEKHNLTRHVKNQHGNLWSCRRCNQSFNRCVNCEVHQRVCLVKITGKRSDEQLDSTAKILKDNISRVNLEDEQQDASNVLDVLKESTFQVENRTTRKL